MDDLRRDLARLINLPSVAAELDQHRAAFEAGVDELIQIAAEALSSDGRSVALALLATANADQPHDKVSTIAAFALVRLAEQRTGAAS